MKTLRTVISVKRCFRIVVLSLLFSAGLVSSKEVSEYPVKAGFLFNFSKFIEWPESCFSSPESPFVLGIYGENPFGESIFLLERQKINGRPVEVRILPAGSRAFSECHMIFIPASQQKDEEALIHFLKNRPVALVGETPGFARSGGMINFYLNNDRIGFEVNLQAVKAGHLEMSSRLLKLSRVIDGALP